MSDTPPTDKTCATCKYKETVGQMVDPYFPCLHEYSIWTGKPKEKYDEWTDERLSWEEIREEKQRELDRIGKIIDESPELQKMIADLFPPK